MDLLNKFTLYDIFLVATGLVLASLIRIFYDSYKEKRRLKKLGQVIKVYNESMDVYEEGVLIIADDNEVIFVNKEASRIFAAKNRKINTEYLSSVRVRLGNSLDDDSFLDIIKKRKNIPHGYVISGNSIVPVSINTNKFHMHFNCNDSWRIVILQDIAYKLKLQERLEAMGTYKDLLTNLPTRYHLTSDLLSVVMNAARRDEESAVGMFGIKDFTLLQSINGLEKMDRVVRSATNSISASLYKNESLYRFDCDSFAVVFENIQEKNDIRKRMDLFAIKLQDALAAEGVKAATMQGLNFIGNSSVTVESIINETYRILKSNNNEKVEGVGDYYARLDTKIDGSKYLAAKLTKDDFMNAIKNKDFFFFYQPIYDLSTDRVIGVEVLTRLNHKKLGFLLASDFMPKAIEFGIMSEITSHLLDNVLGQKAFWSREWDVDFDMTINLALSDMQSGIFTETLEQKLFEHGIDPATITIDIPQMILDEDFESIAEEFYMLNKIGVKLALDHFGSGSINFKHIQKLSLTSIKIDGMLIKDIAVDEEIKNIIKMIIAIARGLDVKVGANHVDSELVCQEVKGLGCDFAQGHFFGKAVPAFEITEIIKNISR